MNNTRFAVKVGFFVAVGLALAALLILNFSKGPLLLQPTYKLHVIMPTVAGLKPAADVMMAGVTVGKVVSTSLSHDGRSVSITVEVLSKYEIRKDAIFQPDTIGFLGDQYIAVTPAEPKPGQPEAPVLKDGETVVGQPPFNIQGAERSISAMIEQGQQTMKDLDKSINNVNNSILDTSTLSNFVATMNNFKTFTGDAVGMAREVRGMLDTNLPPVHTAFTNFQALSEKLNLIADRLDVTISTNAGDVREAVKNINGVAADLHQLADGLQAGQGLAGSLLKDEKMKADFATTVTNVSRMAEEIGRFATRLNENSLWHLLVSKPKDPVTNTVAH